MACHNSLKNNDLFAPCFIPVFILHLNLHCGVMLSDAFRSLCIVQAYPKPAHHPCAPTYLFNPMRGLCELPSDYDHKIPGY
ncbi:hypothetical protein [Sphingomonas sp. KR3-1]|uniref:hypothetical protein n=1 Tax=Sphingomonas sp. KR3-1 TaxID=3156611 RepID=UPI0032B51A4B